MYKNDKVKMLFLSLRHKKIDVTSKNCMRVGTFCGETFCPGYLEKSSKKSYILGGHVRLGRGGGV